ncbi:unnamed protein product [Macrosiphum euphorbiae]|uniref:Uncharacterized protein n=1 Tax=Macrosiphum euphorbiae TaxID=13131 RepID=A0AAV0XWN6_9HEMI|nr:unnamed protein product [Macrosiphum euphorbiae]
MKTINSLFLYISLLISLFSRNVSTFCGNDDQIDNLKTSLIIHETSFSIMTGLSAIPFTAAIISPGHAMASTNFAVQLKEGFEEMKDSMNKDHADYKKCFEIVDKTATATTVIKTTSVGLSIAAMIPGVGLALVPPRVAASISAMLIIRDGLTHWQENGCQYATTRDCNLLTL